MLQLSCGSRKTAWLLTTKSMRGPRLKENKTRSMIPYHSSQRGGITSQTEPIFGPWTQYETFWNFCTRIYISYPAFCRVFKSSKKDENMMSGTRHYVEPTETRTGQGRKMILARNGRICRSCSPDLVILTYWFPLSTTN